MATNSSVFIPRGGEVRQASLNATTSTAELVFSNDTIIGVNAAVDMTIKFGTSGMAAASATDFRIPANQTLYFDLGSAYDRIRLFNITAGAGIYYILPNARS